ncbi:MAG: Sua5/YciO/YrdC/YwlC family protein [Candidatus Gracilibacteria bacterium]
MIYIIPTDTCYGIACSLDDIKNYDKIYKIKKRSFGKPLAIMVLDFNWLKTNTTLNDKQIEFLKNYSKPFTVLTNSVPISLWLNYESENGEGFQNRDMYQKIAFRIAHNNAQKKLIKEVGPIFLTSANTSGEKEIYKKEEIKEAFSYYIEKKIVEILPGEVGNNKASDIFEFSGDGLGIRYLRKN